MLQPDDPLSRAYRSGRMDRPPAADMKSDKLIGFSACPGIALEKGKVVREVAHGEKLNPGDMLEPNTLPSCMLLFARAVALVTADGGLMSHSPVVARE